MVRVGSSNPLETWKLVVAILGCAIVVGGLVYKAGGQEQTLSDVAGKTASHETRLMSIETSLSAVRADLRQVKEDAREIRRLLTKKP